MSKRKRLSVTDIIVVAIILVTAIAGVIFVTTASGSNEVVCITVKGELYRETSLISKEVKEIKVNDANTIVVENGSVYIKESSCEDGECVKQGNIHNVGDSIVCQENDIVVEIKSGSEIDNAVW